MNLTACTWGEQGYFSESRETLLGSRWEHVMRAMSPIKLVVPLAFVLGAAGPAVAQQERFSPTCEIDTTALSAADCARLPAEVCGKSYVVDSPDVPFSELQCTRSADTETMHLTCSKEVQLTQGQPLVQQFTTKDFSCSINLGDCVPGSTREVAADNRTFKAHFGTAPDRIVLELTCDSSTRLK